MYTAMFFGYAALQAMLLAWLWRTWRSTGAAAAAVLLVPQVGLVWDNLIVALGSFIGLGETLYWLSWPRFWIHWLMGAWLIVASGSILRLAGIEWARKSGVMVGFCLLTAAMMAWDIPYFFTKALYPVCEYDLVRYATSVRDGLQCLEGQPAIRGDGPPIPQLVTIIVVGAAGLVLWLRRGFPWFFMGGFLMLLSVMPPFARLKLDNAGEVAIAGGAIWAIWHFARKRDR